jgi:protein-S-isoprenylcysteine O-methyltransferase Ste14
MQDSFFYLIVLVLVILVQISVYLIYQKTQQQKIALLPNLAVLVGGLGVSAYLRFFAPMDGWNDLVSVIMVILTIVATLASLLTSFLMLYIIKNKK